MRRAAPQRRQDGGHSNEGKAGARRLHRAARRRLAAVALLALVLLALGAMAALAGGSAPTAETEKASEVGRTTAVLNAVVNANGSSVSECEFEYGTSPSLGTKQACAYAAGSGEVGVPELASISGLHESTSYFFRIVAKNAHGTSDGETVEFTTLPTKPKANTEDAKSVTRTAATLFGLVTPHDSLVEECFFEYGLTKPETEIVACEQEPGEGAEAVPVTAHLEGLKENTTYFYRVVAHNAFGTDTGGSTNFTTLPSAPRANTEPTGKVGPTSATLKAFVTANDAAIERCVFEWGEAGSFTHQVSCEPTPTGAGVEPELVTAQLTGLSESTTYNYRVVAANHFGEEVGAVARFTTQPTAPKVLIHQVEELTGNSALLKASVNPEGGAITECFFEYGTTPALGGIAPCNSLPPAGEGFVKVTAPVSGLSPETHYLVRVAVRNAFGVARSEKEGFTTNPAGLLPVVSKVKPSKGPARGGTHVKVVGKNLEHATAVWFGDVEATSVTQVSVSEVAAVAPPGVGAVAIKVTTETGTSEPSSAKFTYGAPELASVTPNSGPMSGGTEVTITGDGFALGTEATSFTFGKATATAVDCASSTTCTVIAPPSSKAGTVVVQAIVNKRKSPRKGGQFDYLS